jgi:hypothetical protein
LAATVVIVILIARHRLTWWAYWPITPACFAIVPIPSARHAARNYHPDPPEAETAGTRVLSTFRSVARCKARLNFA